MLRTINPYSTLSDEELLTRITESALADEQLHKYFFYVRCAPLLKYIARKIFKCNDSTQLMGEFYVFLSNNDWEILRKWEKKNDATLYSYIARCATNYFLRRESIERRRQEKEIHASAPETIEILGSIAEEEEMEKLPIWQAYNQLKERDREVLRLLVIEENKVLSVAEKLWKYIDSNQDISQLTPKRIQGTISMVKHRAQLALMEELKKITKN